jgi:hypothetical protein
MEHSATRFFARTLVIFPSVLSDRDGWVVPIDLPMPYMWCALAAFSHLVQQGEYCNQSPSYETLNNEVIVRMTP